MAEATALKVAIDLLHVPSRVRYLRTEPLPPDVLTVLRIAACDGTAEAEAVEVVGRPADLVRAACTFFIEQLLLTPEADSYRVLGADRDATAAELRRNMALLLRWLHPDLDRGGSRSVFAGRVTTAWENLKTPERRAAYDKDSERREPGVRRRRGKSPRPLSREERYGRLERRHSLLQRALQTLFGRARYR